MTAPPEVATVVATLRTVAGWGRTDPRTLRDLADELTACADPGDLHPCCPVCQEIYCDSGCPLAPVRAPREGEA